MTPPDRNHIDRRRFLALLAAAGISACTPDGRRSATSRRSERAPATEADRTPPPSPSGTPTAPAASEAAAFRPLEGDAYPNAKRIAGRFVEALTSYDPGTGPRRVLRKAAANVDDEFDFDRVLRRARALFVPDAFSAGRVVYPQLGGLQLGGSVDRICVMVVVRQELLRPRRRREPLTSAVTRAVDVRLINRDDEWRIEDVSDSGGRQVRQRRSTLPAAAGRVLADQRIELPDSARWDILRGDIDRRLLVTMAEIADVAPYSVAVLKSGHPVNVFGTDRVSGHTMGRGVDIWKVGGQPVVLQQDDRSSDAFAFTKAALDDFDVPELGSPWDLDGPPTPGTPKPSFTDAVHADHIHIAFKAA